jgi:hypothetical protein
MDNTMIYNPDSLFFDNWLSADGRKIEYKYKRNFNRNYLIGYILYEQDKAVAAIIIKRNLYYPFDILSKEYIDVRNMSDDEINNLF